MMNLNALSKEQLQISKVQEKEMEGLFQNPNVVGVGVGTKIIGDKDTGEPCLTLFVNSKLNKDSVNSSDLLPSKVGTATTDIIEAGEVSALSDITLRKKIRPAEGGYSVGHYKVTAGTIATSVTDRKPIVGIPKKYYILSNNHVLANSNSANLGDPIYQPGRVDGGKARDTIARLSKYIPIKFIKPGRPIQCNWVDAAIAEGDLDELDREVYWTGYVDGMAKTKIREVLHKTGRTTGHTTGRVLAVNASLNVNYGRTGYARFCRQIVTTAMAAPGDSGSLVTNGNNNAVGLLFAGSSSITIINPIQFVMSMLKIKFH